MESLKQKVQLSVFVIFRVGVCVSISPFKGILIKCLLEALNYIKITQQNISLDSIIVPVSCVKSDRFILSVKTVHLGLCAVFSFCT